MPTHHFQVEIAEAYGVNAAILLENIYFWVEKNRANEKHFHDGRYWTYNSMKAYTELFPYMGDKQVRNALKKLQSEELIITGNYNKSAYDQTKWYSLTEKGKNTIEHFWETAFAQRANGNDERANQFVERANDICPKGEPIPDNKTQIVNTDNINTDDKTQDCLDIKSKQYVTLMGNDDIYARAREEWNTLSGFGIKPIRDIAGKRKEMLQARIRQYGEQAIFEAIEKIRGSDFLQGKGDKGWAITFDWFVKPINFSKVLEGNYDNRSQQGKKSTGSAYIDAIHNRYDAINDFLKEEEERNGP